MKTLFRAVGFSALLLASSAGVSLAQPAPSQPSMASHAEMMAARPTLLNLSAYGETRIAPDMATITLGVTVEAPTAAEALRANAAKMNLVIAALKRGGIESRDIQTSGLSLNPQYVYAENVPPRLTGYQVVNQVTVVVHDLTKLGAAVDATVGAGATNVSGISFGLSDPKAAEDAARLQAVRALQAKAQLYAGATGLRLGRLVTLNEGGGYTPPSPPVPMYALRAQAADSTPTEAGELKVRIDITAVYELAN